MSTDGIDAQPAITAQTEVNGLPYETIASLKNVQQLDLYDRDNAVILTGDGTSLDLKTIALP